MKVDDLALITDGSQPHYGEIGRIVEIFWCFISVQFGATPLNFWAYFEDELEVVIISPSTISLALTTCQSPLG